MPLSEMKNEKKGKSNQRRQMSVAAREKLAEHSGLVAGVGSGFVQTIVGHPFDTVKVLMQSRKQIAGKSHKQAFRIPPLRKLYRGFWYPFSFNGLFMGATFAINESVRNRLGHSQDFVSGAVAGAIGALTSPIDLYKIRAQSAASTKALPAPNLFRGFLPTLCREVPASALYFGLYRWLEDRRESNVLLHGGVAGVVCWFVSYPFDTVKTRVQSGSAASMRIAFSQGNLWRGIVPCLVRSFVVNACGFYAYEHFRRLIAHAVPPPTL